MLLPDRVVCNKKRRFEYKMVVSEFTIDVLPQERRVCSTSMLDRHFYQSAWRNNAQDVEKIPLWHWGYHQSEAKRTLVVRTRCWFGSIAIGTPLTRFRTRWQLVGELLVARPHDTTGVETLQNRFVKCNWMKSPLQALTTKQRSHLPVMDSLSRRVRSCSICSLLSFRGHNFRKTNMILRCARSRHNYNSRYG
jgi:hypothetical protein